MGLCFRSHSIALNETNFSPFPWRQSRACKMSRTVSTGLSNQLLTSRSCNFWVGQSRTRPEKNKSTRALSVVCKDIAPFQVLACWTVWQPFSCGWCFDSNVVCFLSLSRETKMAWSTQWYFLVGELIYIMKELHVTTWNALFSTSKYYWINS